MKSRLLTRQQLEALCKAGNLQTLIAALARTPYRRSLEAALVRLEGREAVNGAMRDELETTAAGLRRFYQGKAASQIAILLRANDIRNLKAVLRQLSSAAAPEELGLALLPPVELSTAILYELGQAVSPRAAIDLLASMALPFATPLVRLRVDRPGATTMEMELRLEQWYFEHAFAAVEQMTDETLFQALSLDADLINLQTALRLAATPDEQRAMQEWLGSREIKDLFVASGRLSFDLLARAGAQQTVRDAVSLLAHTRYGAALAAGMEEYRRTQRLSSFEKELYHLRLKTFAAFLATQSLGIGVVLGYLALKTNEVNNLRWITNGIHLAMKPDQIRAELVYAA